VRNADDPMREQEVRCFARTLQCDLEQIETVDLLNGVPVKEKIQEVDMVLLGGSGAYSVSAGGAWLPAALEIMRYLYDTSKPTFASCWGFQAMAQALGGNVVKDMNRAELGAITLTLTAAGRQDPVFGALPETFVAYAGHQDIVDELPRGAVLLASAERTKHQAYTFPGKPMYCTQFHPELNRSELLQRAEAYPEYVEKIAGVPLAEFEHDLPQTPEANTILPKFVASLQRN
jgi:GMP synthase (glutamine-hydrolysing)